jgi:hypothetical protein
VFHLFDACKGLQPVLSASILHMLASDTASTAQRLLVGNSNHVQHHHTPTITRLTWSRCFFASAAALSAAPAAAALQTSQTGTARPPHALPAAALVHALRQMQLLLLLHQCFLAAAALHSSKNTSGRATRGVQYQFIQQTNSWRQQNMTGHYLEPRGINTCSRID